MFCEMVLKIFLCELEVLRMIKFVVCSRKLQKALTEWPNDFKLNIKVHKGQHTHLLGHKS